VTNREIRRPERILGTTQEFPLQPAVLHVVDQEEWTGTDLDHALVPVLFLVVRILILLVVGAGARDQGHRTADHRGKNPDHDALAHGPPPLSELNARCGLL